MNIDTSADIIDGGKGCVVKGTCPIDGTADSLDVGESADDGEGSIVGNEECSTDFGELREGGVGQGGAVDKGEGTSDGGQVWCSDGGE